MAFAGREISDVQVRTGKLIYLHTNRGLEIAESFGIQNTQSLAHLAESLFVRQSADVCSENAAETAANVENVAGATSAQSRGLQLRGGSTRLSCAHACASAP